MEDKQKTINEYDPNKWEKCIATELKERTQCDSCKKIVESKKVGEYIFCYDCKKYIWRERP